MHIEKPLTIAKATLTAIKRMAGSVRREREAERELYATLKPQSNDQQAELRALASANAQEPTHIAGVLAEKSNLQSSLTQGLKRCARQS